ncbi:MAG: hypothetical protein IJW06_00585 [Clostridia bacterium]|nr:hypothetical protein [Clostridia bacterium]
MKLKKINKGIMNTLDVVIAVVVISILLATLFKIYNKQIFLLFERSSTATITVSAYSDDIDAKDFTVGQKIYFSDSKDEAGTIVSVENIKEKRYKVHNKVLSYDLTDKDAGVRLEIKTKLKESDSKRYINGSIFVTHGTELYMYTDDVSVFEYTVEEIIISDIQR